MVIAHPDDETLAMGGRLPLFKNLRLIQLTDGAPRQPSETRRAAYAAEREAEMRLALDRLGIALSQRLQCGISDQQTMFHLGMLAKTLQSDLRGMEFVFTHPYEGGHPDHDAAAFAVQTACDLMSCAGHTAPLRLEFASYHCRDGQRIAGAFWPDPSCPEVIASLDREARARKREAVACYRSQSAVVAWFDPDVERYRLAPRYDFLRPPPPGSALYDSFGWSAASTAWREQARAALAQIAQRSA